MIEKQIYKSVYLTFLLVLIIFVNLLYYLLMVSSTLNNAKFRTKIFKRIILKLYFTINVLYGYYTVSIIALG